MAATRLVLGSAILGLFCSGFPKGVLTTSWTSRCDSAPCSCDQQSRLHCDCKDSAEELIISSEGDKRLNIHTSRITVNNCKSVTIASSSFTPLKNLRSVDLENIANLTLSEQSFELSSIDLEPKIRVKNSNIDVLPSKVFRGNIDTISFHNVRIGQVRAFSFANINKTETVSLENCRIENLESQAFKKFDVKFLRIVGGNLGDQIPSRAMTDIEVYENFMLDGVQMGTVRSSAFIIKRSQTVAIQNCLMESLEGEAFNLSARGPVIIKNNTFGKLALGVFLGIRVDRDNRPGNSALYDLYFKDNNLASFEEGSLMFDRSSFRVQLDNVLVSQPCDCQQIPIWKSNILNYTNVYNKLYSGQSASSFSSLISQEGTSEDSDTFFCYNGSGEDLPISFTEFEARSCILSKSMLILGLALGGLILVLLIIGLMIAYCCRRKQRRNSRKRWMSVPTTAPDVVSKKNGVISKDNATPGGPVDSRITMVVPDGRLYKETEFHVIVEKAEPLTTEL